MSIQQEVEQYWEGEAELYSEGIQKELNGFQREAWLKLIMIMLRRRRACMFWILAVVPASSQSFFQVSGIWLRPLIVQTICWKRRVCTPAGKG